MYHLPLPASLMTLHGKTDQEGLVALLPLLLGKPTGFTPDVLAQEAKARGIFPDLDDPQTYWKVRRSIKVFEKVGYVNHPHTAWYVPNVEKIQSECEDACRELGKVLVEISDKGLNLMQAALMGPGGTLPPADPAQESLSSTFRVSHGLKALAARAKKKKA